MLSEQDQAGKYVASSGCISRYPVVSCQNSFASRNVLERNFFDPEGMVG